MTFAARKEVEFRLHWSRANRALQARVFTGRPVGFAQCPVYGAITE